MLVCSRRTWFITVNSLFACCAMPETYIYTLQLDEGFYYVVSSKNVQARFQQHLQGNGSAWTRLHRPIRIDTCVPCGKGETPGLKEDSCVKELMIHHGMEKVRGGQYSNCQLSEAQEHELTRTIRHAANHCLQCGREGHYAKNCYARTDTSGRYITGKRITESPARARTHERVGRSLGMPSNADKCFRCGREGHSSNSCYAKTDVSGRPIASATSSTEKCRRCGRVSHTEDACFASTHVSGSTIYNNFCGSSDRKSHTVENSFAALNVHGEREGHFSNSCYARTDVSGRPIAAATSSTKKCRRCGRTSHTEDACFASTHVKGYRISDSS